MTLVVIAVSCAVGVALIAAVALAARGSVADPSSHPEDIWSPDRKPGHLWQRAGRPLRKAADAMTRAAETGSVAPPFGLTLCIFVAAAGGVLFLAGDRLPVYAILIYIAGLSGAAILAFSAALVLISAGRAARKPRRHEPR